MAKSIFKRYFCQMQQQSIWQKKIESVTPGPSELAMYKL